MQPRNMDHDPNKYLVRRRKRIDMFSLFPLCGNARLKLCVDVFKRRLPVSVKAVKMQLRETDSVTSVGTSRLATQGQDDTHFLPTKVPH